MNNYGGALGFNATVGQADFNKAFDDMGRRVTGFVKNADKEVSSLDNTFAKLGQVAAGAFAFGALSQIPGQIVKVRGEFQQLEIAFTTMLKSKAASDQLLSEVVDLAATTPFGLKDAAQATKQLLAYGSSAKEVISELRMLGDVAAGVGAPIGDLAYLYGTLRTQGRAFTVDIRQFAGRGIPIYEELGKVLGVATDQVSKFVEEGKVGFTQVQQAFKNMSGEGGTFENLMAQQSKSLTGLTSQFSDAIEVMLNNIGKSGEGLAGSVISTATDVVENYQSVADVLTVLVGTYGAYKAAIVTVNAMKVAEATTSGLVSGAVNKQSGSYAREIALKVKSAEATASRTAALAAEAFAESLAAAATVQSLRAEVSAAAAKKASAIESAKSAAAEITAAEARLAAAQVNQAATAQYLSAAVRNSAAKELEISQNALLVASENGVTARKAASAASADFLAKKTALETATKRANTLATATNTTAAAASVAAQNAAAVASTRLTSLQALQIAVTRQLATAQAAFNATLLSNPIVLGTVAIAALAGAMWYLSDGTTAAEAAQASFNKILEDQKKKKEELVATTAELMGIINSETSTNFAQIQAYKALQAQYPKVLSNLDLHSFKLKSTAEAQKLLNEAIDQMGVENTSAAYKKATAEVDRLGKKLETLKSSNAAGGLTVPILDTEKALQQAKQEVINIGNEIKKNTADAWEATTPAEEQVKHYENIKTALISQRSELEQNALKTQKLGGYAETVKSIFEGITLTNVGQQIDWLTGKVEVLKKGLNQTDPNAKDGGNKTYWEGEKKKAEEALEKIGRAKEGSNEWKQLEADIKKADKALAAYNIKAEKPKKVAERDKPQPFGSIAYYEQIARKADEILSKTPGNNTKEIAKQNGIKIAAEKSAEAIRKQYAVKTFDEELEEKKRKYELYQLWVDNYSKTAADTQFASLIQKGNSYASYLDGQIKALEAQRDTAGVGLIAPEEEQLVKLKVEYNEVTGSEKPLEAFQRRLDNIRDSATSLTEEIEALKRIQSELDPNDMSPVAIAKRQTASQQTVDAERERARQIKDYLESVVGSEEQRLAIERKYANLRAALEVRFGNERGAIYKKALDNINKEEQKEYNEQGGLLATKSKEFTALTKLIENSTREQTKIRLNAAKEQLRIVMESYGEESEEYRNALKNVRDAEEDHKQKSIQNWGLVADAVLQLGDILQSMGGIIGEVGGALSGLGSQFGNVSAAFNAIGKDADGKTTISANGYAAALQGVLQIVGSIISANKKRHEDEKAFALARISFENQYQLALNQQIGQSYSGKDSIFNKDIEAKIKAGVDQYQDAQKKYQQAIDKLEEGRAKTRQKNVVDGKTTGQLIGAGAATGAVIGAIVGGGVLSGIAAPVGAAVGAVVGLIGGLFAKKKKDVFGGLLEQYPELILKGVDGWETLNVAMAKSLIATGQVDDKTKELLETTIAYGDELENSKSQILEGLSELSGSLGDSIREALVGAFRDGTDAAQAFGKAVGDVIADMASKLLFTTIFAQKFKDLENAMVSSYGLNGDGTVIDDIGKFFADGDVQQGVKDYMEGLELINKEMEKYGLNNVFGKTSGTSKDPLKGAIQGMSEETAGLLAGQFNAIRITNADISQSMRQSLIHLSAISTNTSYNKNLVYLSDVVDELKKLNGGNSVRPYGLG